MNGNTGVLLAVLAVACTLAPAARAGQAVPGPATTLDTLEVRGLPDPYLPFDDVAWENTGEVGRWQCVRPGVCFSIPMWMAPQPREVMRLQTDAALRLADERGITLPPGRVEAYYAHGRGVGLRIVIHDASALPAGYLEPDTDGARQLAFATYRLSTPVEGRVSTSPLLIYTGSVARRPSLAFQYTRRATPAEDSAERFTANHVFQVGHEVVHAMISTPFPADAGVANAAAGILGSFVIRDPQQRDARGPIMARRARPSGAARPGGQPHLL